MENIVIAVDINPAYRSFRLLLSRSREDCAVVIGMLLEDYTGDYEVCIRITAEVERYLHYAVKSGEIGEVVA